MFTKLVKEGRKEEWEGGKEGGRETGEPLRATGGGGTRSPTWPGRKGRDADNEPQTPGTGC